MRRQGASGPAPKQPEDQQNSEIPCTYRGRRADIEIAARGAARSRDTERLRRFRLRARPLWGVNVRQRPLWPLALEASGEETLREFTKDDERTHGFPLSKYIEPSFKRFYFHPRQIQRILIRLP